MGKITLYGTEISPPVRAVLLTLKALKLPYDFVEINLFEKDQLKLEYIQKNPQHTVPTLEDDGHYICDSHAINAYLVRKYAKADNLYPKDLAKRLIVIDRLHFESGALYCNAYRRILWPILFENITHVSKETHRAILEVYKLVDKIVTDHPYIAGDTLTIADFSFISSVTSLKSIFAVYLPQHKRLSAWIERMKKLPYYEEANGKGADEFKEIIRSKEIVFDCT